MNQSRTTSLARLAALLVPLTLASGAAAQDAPPTPAPVPVPPIETTRPTLDQLQPDAGQQEMARLFRQIELRLREIDRLLSDASAGDTSALDDVGEAGIGQLLDLSQQNCQRTLEDIDRILQIANEMGSQSSQSSGSCEKPGGEGQSPMDKPGTQQTQREATPDAPEQQPAQAGEQQGQKPEGGEPKPDPGGSKPQDGRASNDPDPRNRPGDDPAASERAGMADANGLDRWGDLPITVRDVFRTEGGSDLPPRYRDWIDSYYRRLNDRRP